MKQLFIIFLLSPFCTVAQDGFWFIDIPGVDGEYAVPTVLRASKTVKPKDFCTSIEKADLGFSKKVYLIGSQVKEETKDIEDQEITLQIPFDKSATFWDVSLLNALLIDHLDLYEDILNPDGQFEIRHIRLLNVRVRSINHSSKFDLDPGIIVKLTAEGMINAASPYDDSKKAVGTVSQFCFDFITNASCGEKL